MSVPISNEQCRAFFEIPFQNCSICDNPMGIFTCHGCCRPFCMEHSIEHRASLETELHTLRQRASGIQTEIHVDTTANERRTLIAQIATWKEQSIARIEQAAEEALRNVSDTFSTDGRSLSAQLVDCHAVFVARLRQAETRKD